MREAAREGEYNLMKWKDFLIVLTDSEEKRVRIMDDLSQFDIFLQKSNLVITHFNKHYEFKREMSVVNFFDHKELFVDSQLKNKLLEFIDYLCWQILI